MYNDEVDRGHRTLTNGLGNKEEVLEMMTGNGMVQDGTWRWVIHAPRAGRHNTSANTLLYNYVGKVRIVAFGQESLEFFLNVLRRGSSPLGHLIKCTNELSAFVFSYKVHLAIADTIPKNHNSFWKYVICLKISVKKIES